MDLISIIVPVYNVAPYLSRCIETILSQTYQNIEILLIDDGSTDDSPKICDEYAIIDKRIKVIHKTNGGVSSARNLGVKISNGVYIAFVDSDDTIQCDYIEIMYNNAIDYNVLLSCCQLDVIEIDGTSRKLDEGRIGLYSKDEILKCYFSNQFIKDQMYGPYNKLIYKSLLKTITFKPYRLGEDILFIFELLQKCDKVYIDKLRGYHYIHREGSAMTSSFSEKNLDYIFAGEEIMRISRNECPYLTPTVEAWLFEHILVTMRQICLNNKISYYKNFYAERKKFLRENVRFLNGLPFLRKMDYMALFCFPVYFKIVKTLRGLSICNYIGH